jgi:hypothetical protein
MRERLWRKLEALPDEQLYEALDFIEFLEVKYAPERSARPGGLQGFAERLEDGLRARSVAPQVIRGTVGLMGVAQKAMRTVNDVGSAFLGQASPAGTRPPARGDAGSVGRSSREVAPSARPEENEQPGDVA